MKIDWKRKLSSRKLWIAVIGIISGIAAAFGFDENAFAQAAGIAGSISSCIAFILGEAAVDAAK